MTRSRMRKLRRAYGKHQRKVLRKLPLAAAISTLAAGGPAALAQERTDSTGLQTIVVTAQKRTENLQQVPLSIQAIDTEKLEDLHVLSFNDYAKFLPSVAFQTLGPGFARVFMRGVASGDNGNHSGPLPSVGVYLDEQPVTTIQGSLDIHVYDIARIESLAGPQGTLYGASSQAGTIRIITNKPDPSGFKAGYDVQGNMVAHGSGGYVAEGFANVPLTSVSAIRLVGWAEHDSGYIDNVPGTLTYPDSGFCIANTSPAPAGCTTTSAHAKKHYNDVDTYGGRAALRVDLNDSWTITPTVMGQQQNSDGNFGYNPKVGDLKLTHFYPEGIDDHWVQAALTVEGKISNFDLVYAGSYLKRNTEVHQDYTDYSTYYDFYSNYIFDNAGHPINPSQRITARDHYTKQSHELRLSSPADFRFRFVAGLFMQRQTHGILQQYIIDDLATASAVTGWPNTWWLTQQVRVDRDYAAFTELNFDITDKLTATGGIRFFKAKNSLEGFYGFGLTNDFTSSTGEKSCFGGPFHGAPCKNLDKEVNETGHTPKINLTYKFDPQHLIYATYSKGFRPGGVNRRGTFPPYKSDYLTNYEAGWKTTWFDNRLRFNGAVFVEKWKDFQFSFLGENALTNIVNAGQAKIKGVEGEIEWLALSHLNLNAGFTYLDAKLTDKFCKNVTNGVQDDPCAPEAFAPNGSRLPITPKFKGNLTARYFFTIADFDAHVQGTYAYQSSSESALVPDDAAILGNQGAYGIFDFTTGLDRHSYSLELFVNNAFDKRAVLSRYAECDPTKCGVVNSYIVPNQPRTVGVRFGQKFSQ